MGERLVDGREGLVIAALAAQRGGDSLPGSHVADQISGLDVQLAGLVVSAAELVQVGNGEEQLPAADRRGMDLP